MPSHFNPIVYEATCFLWISILPVAYGTPENNALKREPQPKEEDVA
jgi:hypothetical protein